MKHIHRVLIAILALSACNPLAPQSTIQTAFHPGVDGQGKNSAPILASIADRTIEYGGATLVSFTVDEGAETYEDSQTLTVSATSSDPALIPNASVVVNYADNGSDDAAVLTPNISLTPTDGAVGTATITVTVTDSEGLSTTKSFDVTVEHPPPTVTSVSPTYGRQGNTITLTGTRFRAGMTVSLASGTCTSPTVLTATSATCVVSVQAKPARVNVTATNSDGKSGTLTSGFIHLGNPRLWLRADTITGVANGATFNTWNDSSSSGFNASASAAAARPTYRTNEVNGLPAVYFDGTNDHVHLGANYIFSTTAGITTFAVLNSVADRTIPFFVDFGITQPRQYALKYDVDSIGMVTPLDFGGAISGGVHATPVGNFVIYAAEAIFNSNQRMYLNGTATGAPVAITLPQITANEVDENPTRIVSRGPFTIGMQAKTSNEDTRCLNGSIAELVVITEKLTTAERELVECYLSDKYNIAIGHGC